MPEAFTFREKTGGVPEPGKAAEYVRKVLSDTGLSKQKILRRCVLHCRKHGAPFDPGTATRSNSEGDSGRNMDRPEVDRPPKSNGGPTARELAQQQEEESTREDDNARPPQQGNNARNEENKPFWQRWTS